jgi:hypothetical protein
MRLEWRWCRRFIRTVTAKKFQTTIYLQAQRDRARRAVRIIPQSKRLLYVFRSCVVGVLSMQ